MGKHIDTIKVLRSTGQGSSVYGGCDQCGKHMSETFVMQSRRLFQREDGSIYEGPASGGAYGHRECLIKHFGQPNIER